MANAVSRILSVSGHVMVTSAAMAALGGIGYWGHATGWAAPTFSDLTGKSEVAEVEEDWCESHNVPDSKCLACHPELGGADPGDWCKEHGVAESKCTVCHPEILSQGQAADWCREHGVPESQCTLCHPEIAMTDDPASSAGGTTISLEPGASPTKDPRACQTHQIRVQFASADSVRKAGIRLEAVQERPIATAILTPGEVDYDSTRVARIPSRSAGTVWRVRKSIGDEVKRGEIVAVVDSAEVGRAKSDLLQALLEIQVKAKSLESLGALAREGEELARMRSASVERLRTATEGGFRPKGELQEAEALAQEAKVEVAKTRTEIQEAENALVEARLRMLAAHQVLLNLGLPLRLEDLEGAPQGQVFDRVRLLGLGEELASEVDLATASGNLLPVTASMDGVVIDRKVVEGETIDPSTELLVVADTARMWIELDVRQEDVERVRLGQPVVFRADGSSGGTIGGTVSWISTAVDETTRTVRVRAEVPNPERGLRAHTFGRGRIVVRESPTAVAVPTEAIHWEGCCHVVFVRLTDEVFQTRKVRPGAAQGPYTEVLVGVVPGEVVATKGSHVLKAELLKSKLGAGCVDD